MTPTPEGNITASDLWKGQQEDNPPAEVTEDGQDAVRAEEVQKD